MTWSIYVDLSHAAGLRWPQKSLCRSQGMQPDRHGAWSAGHHSWGGAPWQIGPEQEGFGPKNGCVTPIFVRACRGNSAMFRGFTYNLPRETETVEKAGTSQKDGVLSKNPVFWVSQFSISALSHEVLPLILQIQQCSYQHVASFLCRAGLESLLGNYSYMSQCMPYTFPSTKILRHINVNFCIPGAYATNWIVYLHFFFSQWASDPFSHHESCLRKDHQQA